MLNHHPLAYGLLLLAFLTTGFPSPAQAQEAASPPPPTVTGIHVDKTAENAVVARAQAIIAAQRTAFEILAEKSMSPDAFKTYQVPDDATIESLVRDFQISNERMSTNRYVADFTVRFTPQISNYITLPQGLGVVQASPAAAGTLPAPDTAITTETATAAPAAPVSADASVLPDAASSLSGIAPAPPETAPLARRNILVLPYLEQTDGSRMLWDDPNPWRDAWQEKGTANPQPRLTVTVPLGDLTDVSSGNPDAVWKGDYRTIEELRANYSATAVAVVLAHMSPDAQGVDIYLYKDGTFSRMQTVPGTFDTPASFKAAVPLVIRALEAPQPYGAAAQPQATMPQTPLPTPVSVVNEIAPAGTQMSIGAVMDFSDFAAWMQAQKRLASVTPPLAISISSLTTHAAHFNMSFTGTIESLRAALAAQGIEMGQPAVEVGNAVLGSAAPTQKTVYQIRLVARRAPSPAPAAATPVENAAPPPANTP